MRDAAADTTMTIRLLLLDDHELFREALSALLACASDLRVVAETGCARQALARSEALAPDVAVVDISLAGQSGIEAARELRRGRPALQVLMLTMHAHDEHVLRAFAAGATGYVLKNDPGTVIMDAIRTVGRGERFLSPLLSTSVLARRDPAARQPLELLSRREREVFDLVIQGYSTRAIARALFIAPKTVETHRTNINRKLSAHSSADLVRLAARAGLLT